MCAFGGRDRAHPASGGPSAPPGRFRWPPARRGLPRYSNAGNLGPTGDPHRRPERAFGQTYGSRLVPRLDLGFSLTTTPTRTPQRPTSFYSSASTYLPCALEAQRDRARVSGAVLGSADFPNASGTAYRATKRRCQHGGKIPCPSCRVLTTAPQQREHPPAGSLVGGCAFLAACHGARNRG